VFGIFFPIPAESNSRLGYQRKSQPSVGKGSGEGGRIIGGDPPRAGRRPFMLTAAKRTPCRKPMPGCYNSKDREAD